MNVLADELLGFKHVLSLDQGLNAPVLVLLHGTGGDESDLLEFGAAMAGDANLLGVRGRSREEGMNRFFRRYAEGVFDEHDMRLESDALTKFLAQIRERHGLTGPMIAVGYSNGANMAAATMLLHPKVLAGAILLRAMLPLPMEDPISLAGTHVLMVNGEGDRMAPLESATALAERLREAGAIVSHRLVPTGHALSRSDFQLSAAWYAEWSELQKSVAKS